MAKAGARPGLKIGLIVSLFLILAVWGYLLAERSIIPTLIAISQSEVTRLANGVMIDTINEYIGAILDGRTLLEFERGPTGELLYVRTNTTVLNVIQADALDVLQKAMEKLEGFVIKIPLGQASGSKILANAGPRIPIKVVPFGSVRSEVVDSYDATGINQTVYSISLRASCSVRIVIPFLSADTDVTTMIPLASVLIPGKVPDTYLSVPPSWLK